METEGYKEVATELRSLFIIFFISLSVIVLGYIGIKGYHISNIRMGFVVIIFGFLLTIGIITALGFINSFSFTSKGKGDFWEMTWQAPSLMAVTAFLIASFIVKVSAAGEAGNTSPITLLKYFTILALVGITIWATIKKKWKIVITSVIALPSSFFIFTAFGFSMFTIEKNSLVSTFASQVPRVADFYINAVMVPVIEEVFWLITIPIVVFLMMDLTGKSDNLSFFSNKIFQLAIAVIISGISFAVFHAGRSELSFIIAAFIFRTINIVLFWGDAFYDIIPFADILPSFNIGFHVGNNWATYGVFTGFTILAANPWGIVFIIIVALIVLSAALLVWKKTDKNWLLRSFVILGLFIFLIIYRLVG